MHLAFPIWFVTLPKLLLYYFKISWTIILV